MSFDFRFCFVFFGMEGGKTMREESGGSRGLKD